MCLQQIKIALNLLLGGIIKTKEWGQQREQRLTITVVGSKHSYDRSRCREMSCFAEELTEQLCREAVIT